MAHPVIQLTDVHRGQFINILVVDAEMQGFLVQTCPFTIRTHIRLGKLFRPFLCGGRSFLFLHHLNVFHDALV